MGEYLRQKKEYLHETKNGRKIPISKLEDDHLKNIIKWIERRAAEGVQVVFGGGSCAEDMWADVEYLYGDEAKEYLNYDVYMQEAKKRKIHFI